ncbi:MAG: restriction endonuclease [bacterium]
MNEWVRKSIKIANAPGYLDNLHNIYSTTEESWRAISVDTKKELEEIFKSGDDVSLVRELLRLPKFPINDPYVAFLRKKDVFVKYNPKTVNRIAKRVRSLGFKAIIEAIEEPKASSRRIGILFRKWLPSIGYPVLPESEFGTYKGIAFLQGSDAQLRNFANEKLGCNLEKGLDFLAKVKDIYLIGEVKFLTDYGGAQNANFEDALRLFRKKEGNAMRIAVLDGVVWIKDGTKMYRTVCELEETALTALLLKKFLESQ